MYHFAGMGNSSDEGQELPFDTQGFVAPVAKSIMNVG